MHYLINNQNITDPALNLALEEYVVRNPGMTEDYFLLSFNSPAVIIGRHQNAFEEINLLFLRKKGIPVIRRLSGGGTVYHDKGNLNFSFITRYEKFKFNNYRFFNQPILEALHSLGIRAKSGGRNDLVIGQRKISGNAQFTSKNRMISHGTLLFRSRLDLLNQALLPPGGYFDSRAIKSARRRVVNVSDYLPRPMSMNKFRRIILEYVFRGQKEIPEYNPSLSQWNEIRQLADRKYHQWKWNFGESPDFSYHNKIITRAGEIQADLEIHKGLISKITISGEKLPVNQGLSMQKKMINLKYDPDVIKKTLSSLKFSSPHLKNLLQVWISLLFSPS